MRRGCHVCAVRGRNQPLLRLRGALHARHRILTAQDQVYGPGLDTKSCLEVCQRKVSTGEKELMVESHRTDGQEYQLRSTPFYLAEYDSPMRLLREPEMRTYVCMIYTMLHRKD
jgi:hypothetical protein